MKLAAVIGDPISHSRSPYLHGHWLRRYGVDGAYVPLRVTANDLETTLKLLPRLGFVGCNVTLPHKERVLALSTSATDRAKRIGAANTLTFTDAGFHVDNTDSPGFLANLRNHSGWQPNAPAVVLGAGGAARAVLDALGSAGVTDIRLANRTRAKAETLAQHFKTVTVVDWLPSLTDAGLIVNTTSLGMTGQPPLDIDLTDAPPNAVVTDIVYSPLETPLLRQAKAIGLETVDGLGMLLHQAGPGFEAWFGVAPEVDDELRAAVFR